MDTFENDSQRDINAILAIIKFMVLLFGITIVAYEVLIKKNIIENVNSTQNMVVIYGVFVPLLLVVYFLWSHLYLKMNYIRYPRTILILENCISAILFSVLIIFSQAYSNQFKLLFLFVTVSSVIQLGARFGIIMALVSSLIILTIDLVCTPAIDIKILFQNDLVLVGSIILVAISLGKYVELQKESINRKNKQLQLLNTKLTEQEIQRKHIENMILKNEICYNLLINNSNDAIFIHRDSKLIFSNEEAAQIVGVHSKELLFKSVLEFMPDGEKDAVMDRYNSIYKNETGTISFEQKIISKNGIESIVQNTSTCFIYEGKPTILTILHDISSEKRVEVLQKDVQRNIELLNETREFNKLVTEFFSNISHELKTPLNIIFSSVQLLDSYSSNNMDKLLDSKDKYLDIMKQNCYRLMRLINNLLDITRADSGFLIPHMNNYNIVSIVEDITMSVASFAESKGISLIFDTDCEEKIIAVDPDKIERIILNLLSNALKFTCYGGQILVNIFDKEDYVVISVKDTGIGMPQDKLGIIFERFRQVDRTFTRNHEGSGIGLSLVKSFVEMHEGIIEVNSQLEKGSEFIVKLPSRLCNEDYEDTQYVDDNIIERINIEFSDIYS